MNILCPLLPSKSGSALLSDALLQVSWSPGEDKLASPLRAISHAIE